MKKAVCLVSGGLDSATTLAMARDAGYECYSMAFDYGQRHRAELHAAEAVARDLGARDHKVIRINMGDVGGSALTDTDIDVPETEGSGIPVTYVPARNTIFLSFALGWAEVLEARDIFIGVNAVDYSGYPDCRPAFIEKFQELANIATAAEHPFEIHAPLLHMTKAEIIRTGQGLGVDYGLTVSCYRADEAGRACGRCDSCHYRQQGFRDAGVPDPTRYA